MEGGSRGKAEPRAAGWPEGAAQQAPCLRGGRQQPPTAFLLPAWDSGCLHPQASSRHISGPPLTAPNALHGATIKPSKV